MGETVMDLLPGDVELARRAAGGDGAAFVRLFDHYSADVFEASLAATGEVDGAADATQLAFLNLLRRPPAMGAPESEVAARLRALAGAAAQAAPVSRGTTPGHHAPAGAGVGWLRSETVAKAGARFDEDWSAHLAHETPPRATRKEGVATELPLVMAATPAAVEPLPALRQRDPSPPRRRRRPRWLALPSPAVAAALLLLLAFAGAAGLILAGSGGEQPSAESSLASVDPAPAAAPSSDARARARAEGARPGRASRAAKGRPASRFFLGARERASGGDRPASTRTISGVRRITAGGRVRTLAGGPGSPRQPAIIPDAQRSPTAVKSPPPQREAAPPPAQEQPASPSPDPAPAEPAPAPAPTETQSGSGGTKRNCNSKNSASPC